MLESNLAGKMKKNSWVSIVCIKMVVQGKGEDESTEGIVDMMKSRRPRTEPWEHHRRRYTRMRKCYYI